MWALNLGGEIACLLAVLLPPSNFPTPPESPTATAQETTYEGLDQPVHFSFTWNLDCFRPTLQVPPFLLMDLYGLLAPPPCADPNPAKSLDPLFKRLQGAHLTVEDPIP